MIVFKHWFYSQMLYFYRTQWGELDLIENTLGAYLEVSNS